jgi:YVTN family beta-propeller protein
MAPASEVRLSTSARALLLGLLLVACASPTPDGAAVDPVGGDSTDAGADADGASGPNPGHGDGAVDPSDQGDAGADGGSGGDPGLPLPTPEPRLDQRGGPGLGNLSYDDNELWKPIARVDNTNGVPSAPAFVKAYGLNTAIFHDGYLMTLFAPDSGGGPGGFLFYDVGNPRAISLAHRLYEPEGRTQQFREAHAIGLSYFDGGEFAALHTGRGIEIWEVSDIRNAQQVGKLELQGINFGDYDAVSWQLFWQGRYLYVAASEQGIFIVDVEDPYRPVLVDRGPGRPNPVPPSELGGFRIGPIFAVGNLLVATNMEADTGYSTLDISDPKNPALLSTLRRGLKKFYATTFNGNRIVGAVRGGGARMTLHDTTNPRHIALVDDKLEINEQLYAATQDRFVFQGCQEEVVKVDVTNPGQYWIVGRGTLDVPHSDHGQVTPFGNLVFVGNDHGSGSGLIVHDKLPDSAPPVVNMVHPADGAVAQAPTTRIGLTFTDNVEPYSVNETTVVVRPIGGEGITGRYSVQHGIANFWPDQPLAPNTRYEVIVQAGGVADWAGNLTQDSFRSTFTTAPSVATPPLDERLVAWWRLDQTQADVAQDSSPSGAHGILQGDAHVGSEGLVLDGDGDSVRMESPALDFDGDLTVLLWVRTTSTSSSGSDSPGDWWQGEWFVDKDEGPGWAITNHFGKVNFAVNENDQTIISSSRIDDGTWHHIGAVRDTQGRRFLYIDGMLEASAEGGSSASLTHGADFFLGSDSGGNHFARAELRDVQVFRGALSADEVSARMLGEGRLRVTLSPIMPTLAGSTVTFETQASGTGALLYSFDFGDGTAPSTFTAESTAKHKFNTPGHYPITVSITNGVEVASASALLTVHRALRTPRPTRSRSLAYDEAHKLVCAANPDHDSVSCLDPDPLALRFEVNTQLHPTSLAFGPDGTLWVANEGSDSISVVRLSSATVTRTIMLPRGSHPYGVVFTPDRTRAFVTLEATGELAEVRSSDGAVVRRLAVGANPRGVSVSHDAKKAYVTRFVSPDARAELREVDLATFKVLSTIALAADKTTLDGEDRARGLPNYLGSLSISPDGKIGHVPAKLDNIFRGTARDGRPLTFESSVRALAMQVNLANASEVLGARVDFNDREGPRDIELSPLGDYAFVALTGSNMVEVRDGYSGALVSAMRDTGAAPIGLAMSDSGDSLFVQNFLTRDIAAYDTRALVTSKSFEPRLLSRVRVSAREPLAEDILRGKTLFYNAIDPRIGRDGYIACASCHRDGGQDGRTWDFSDRGEGLRNTITLRGRGGLAQGALHWSANFDEVQDFENDIRNAFGGRGLLSDAQWNAGTRKQPLGDRKSGLSTDLDALAAFVSSLSTFEKSPHRASDGALTAAGKAGELLFKELACDGCHTTGAFTNSPGGLRYDVGTLKPESGGRLGGMLDGLDTPTLRGLVHTAPYLHDGSAPTLMDVLVTANAAGLHGDVGSLSQSEREQLVRFLLELE